MEAQTVTWLVFLALIIHVSTSDPESPVEDPPTEPKLSMRSEVTEGQTITINCTVESFPQSTLTLARTDTYPQSLMITEINLNSRTSNSLSHTFTVTSSNTGWYFCRAQNIEGSKDSEQKELVVKYSPKHVTVQANPGLDVKENVLLTLSCSAESNPPVSSVTWRKTTDGREEIIQQTQTQTFRVNSASPSDSGLYSCEATNDIGSGKSQPAEVKVRYSPNNVKVQANPGLDVKENVLLTLSCSAESNPPVSSVTWRKMTDGREEIIQQTQTQTFRVNSASPSDSGLYSCEATNDIGRGKSQPAEVKVRYKPRKTSISVSGSSDNQVKVGGSVTLTCDTDANPAPTTYSWYRNKNQQTDSLWKNTNRRELSLTIQRADEACYSCSSSNLIGGGDKSQPVCIQVLYSPKHVTVQANPGLEVNENVLLTLSCSAESNPPVSSVTWRKTTDGREEIIQGTRTWRKTFRVNSASPSDSGLYSCEATNDIGSGKSPPAEVKVRYKPRKTSISVSGSSDNQVKVGGSLTLTCDTDANPAPTTYSWYRSKNQQTDSWWKNTNRRELSLTIQRADEACYSCSASNRIGGGDKSQPVCIQVLYSPKHVRVQANPGLDVKENVLLTLSCSAESNPPVSSVTWRKTTDGREEIIQQTQTLTFRVNSASPSDSGLYSCEATNDIGRGKSQPAEVKVRFSPKHTHITESAEKQELDGRSSVMLSCFSHSFPPVQHYSWYRKSQGEEKDELVSKHQNHTVFSNQPGVYYCIAQNEVDQSLSDPVHLFERNHSLHILKFLLPALFVLMIIILIVIVLRYRKKKFIQQGTTNTKSPSGFSEQLRRPEAQRHQPLPDSTPPTDNDLVYSLLNLPQAASAQNPTGQQAGNTEEDSVNYASLHFKNKLKKKQRKVEEDSVYAKVSKPARVKKNEPESLQDYENINNAIARAPTSPNLFDDHTSEVEVELHYSKVRFTATPRRQTTNRDSSSSHQDESLYSNVRI
ncbi:B-cell receptor CD22-like isoform X2 [Platichthys flesus]|uniref:B-cell receptor CD22-like isoform X2 n=1 Tax=Platichthys flesus TaxID=8260 RepID=UPI002DB84C74|nr:B-cell receptor CD22-like isoform X2 [Platichthys flesus]